MPLVELDIEKVVQGGEAIARVSGKVCFVEGALPGEKVLAEVIADKKNFLRARAIQILKVSPDRETPPCVYVERCGGCQYQHVSYEAELKLKHAQLVETLRNVADASLITPVRHSGKPYRYRNSVTVRMLPGAGKGPRFGFIGRDNKNVVPLADCLLADEALTAVFRGEIRPSEDEKTVFSRTDAGKVVAGGKSVFFRVKIGEESLLSNADGFFQNNLGVTQLLVEQTAQWVDERKPDIFADLYAGVGTFSLLAAKNVPLIVAVEESKPSVDAMRMNREERKRQGMDVVEGRVEKTFPSKWEADKLPGRALFFLDPPRQGLDPGFAKWLSGLDIDSLVYVSCDAPALARDLSVILSQKRFRIDAVVPFDMFPRTRHLETAALLSGVRPC